MRKLTRVDLVLSSTIAPLNKIEGTDTEKRLKAVLKRFQDEFSDLIIVSGGIYLPPDVQTIAAGILMKQWLVDHGVPEDKILVESEALDTYQNLRFSINLLHRNIMQAWRLTVVTQRHHAYRCYVTLWRWGYDYLTNIKPLDYPVPRMEKVRGWLFILYHLWDRNGDGWLARRSRQSRTFPKPEQK